MDSRGVQPRYSMKKIAVVVGAIIVVVLATHKAAIKVLFDTIQLDDDCIEEVV